MLSQEKELSKRKDERISRLGVDSGFCRSLSRGRDEPFKQPPPASYQFRTRVLHSDSGMRIGGRLSLLEHGSVPEL